MVGVGYFAAHEQFSPSELLQQTVEAEQGGFNRVWTSDHFHPWAHTGAHGGFAWTWMSSALERTKSISIGTGVTVPILRYHPGVVAQAWATMDAMYPGRVFLGVGTGEAMSDLPLGYQWPEYKERFHRLDEALHVIKSLWNEEFVNYEGEYFRLKKANLYTKPKTHIPIYISATGPTSAKLAGRHGHALLTFGMSPEDVERKLMRNVRREAERQERDPDQIEKIILIKVSYGPDHEEALKSSRFWGATLLPLFYTLPVADPRVMELHGKKVGRETFEDEFVITTDMKEITEKINQYAEAGFDHVIVQSSSPDQELFIRDFCRNIGDIKRMPAKPALAAP